jgi:hypothetical protein
MIVFTTRREVYGIDRKIESYLHPEDAAAVPGLSVPPSLIACYSA